ncbi:glycosyltransferase [Aestuariirhabdus litorea]|uniref:Glycosyltransferase n=1 Tax=Aestuariirhabdus litorea TaxID=2528527 RepID=A0A3P3VUR5_9GAMM|nr:glycosyltransferase [Aestuariirhabdus litorea]RRJ84493.1 glycosyltransferase [Aestuariirhabdus litorea]RWW97718.1 glycosyltransferase [Endozoicomonadaceae bacterium GTF-13]
MIEFSPKPLVSIVIPCYNHEKYVQKCIVSVMEQDYENIELIIIDDGSKDGSVSKIEELVEECEGRFVRFEFRARPNKGLCATLNEAIEWCKGEFYSAIASDDMMLPGKTSLQVQYFQKHPECDAVFGGMYIIDDNGKVVKTRKGFNGFVSFKDLFLMKRSLATPTQMIRLKKLTSAGLYPQGLYIEDWYMWLRISHAGSIISSLDTPLIYYRRHESNMSGKVDVMSAARKIIIADYKDHSLYRKAQAACQLSEAIDLQSSSQKKSLYAFMRVLRLNPFALFEKRSFNYIIKILYLPIKSKLFVR